MQCTDYFRRDCSGGLVFWGSRGWDRVIRGHKEGDNLRVVVANVHIGAVGEI